MIQEKIHKAILKNLDKVKDWFGNVSDLQVSPIYSSYDLRDSGFKVAPVDANIYPAGFNNICQVDKENAPQLFRDYLSNYYESVKNIVLLTEEHTNNPYYWENVFTLQTTLTEAGYEVRVALPKADMESLRVETIHSNKVQVFAAERRDKGLLVDGMRPDLIISNNDFSISHDSWAEGLEVPVNPPREFGWHQRKKSNFFNAYNELAGEFATVIEIDPWYLQVESTQFSNFDINDEISRKSLATEVDKVLNNLRDKYSEHGIEREPFVFVKNNSGTYGLAVIKVKSGSEILAWNYKSRKKMKAAKGGRSVEDLIIQEGIPTVVTSSGQTAEPAIYMVGCSLVGGFLRTHEKKSPEESLNSPGAIYQRLCVSDLNINVEGCPMENVYGWVSKLGLLAISREGFKGGIQFPGMKGEHTRL